jgi:chromosomal replication initiator protein
MYTLADRLRTRFESGLLADIQPPDYETRTAIIKNKSLQLGLVLSDSVVDYIAENMTSNVRQLEGAIKKIRAHRDLDNIKDSDLTVTVVAKIIKDMFKEKTAYVPTPDDIIEETAKYYGLTAADLKGQSRTRNTTLARQIAMYQIRRLTNLSLQDIGAMFEGRDHSTVLTSIKKIEGSMTEELSQTIKDITANINARG